MEKLLFWHGMETSERKKALLELVEKFNQEHPNIRVEPVCYGAPDLAEQKIIKEVVSNEENGPDLIWYGPQLTSRLAEKDLLAPVKDFIQEDNFTKEPIYDELLSAGIYSEELVTLPFDANNLGIFYNQDYFKQAGIRKPPNNWRQFIKTAQKVQQNSDAQYSFLLPYGRNEWTVWVWETFLWQAGGEIIADNGEIAFNSPAGIEALQFWKDLKDKYRVAELSRPEHGYEIERLKNGRVAMQIVGSWIIPELEKCNLNYNTCMLPKNKRRATALGGENLYILKSTQQKEEAAWEFAKYVVSDEFQKSFAQSTGYLPVTESVFEDDEYQEFLVDNPTIKSFAEQLEDGFTRPNNLEYSTVISPALGEAIEKVLDRRACPEKALEEAEEIVRKNTDLK